VAAETEAGRVRFRRPQRYLRRARTFDKLKVLLDEIETEWADSQQTSRPRALMKTRQLPSSVDVCAMYVHTSVSVFNPQDARNAACLQGHIWQ